MKRVVIVQRRMAHYRIPLFEKLRENLQEYGVLLDVLAGEGTKNESRRRDSGVLSWALPLKTYYLAGENICLQPASDYLIGADLVIITQENKLVYNHWLLFRQRSFKLAFWGHGANLQSSSPNGIKERYKRWTSNRVDWWFAYTQMSVDLVRSIGFPQSKITLLNNSVDTSDLHKYRNSISSQEISALRASVGIGSGPLGIFVGSLHPDKRLEFMFEAAMLIRTFIPDFQLLIVGDGSERERVIAWCDKTPWAHWVGARFAREKVVCLAAAQIMLNPGLVGLGILDSFVCGVPMLTTDCGLHSPEIVYLNHGVNGLISPNNISAYSNTCVEVLRDPLLLQRLREGCLLSAHEYSLDNMVANFSIGIKKALR